jgi:hypothetical protein
MRRRHAPNHPSCRTGAKRIHGKGADVADDPALFLCPGRSQQLALAQLRVTDEEIHQAPNDRPLAHPRDSPGCPLFTFAHSEEMSWNRGPHSNRGTRSISIHHCHTPTEESARNHAVQSSSPHSELGLLLQRHPALNRHPHSATKCSSAHFRSPLAPIICYKTLSVSCD